MTTDRLFSLDEAPGDNEEGGWIPRHSTIPKVLHPNRDPSCPTLLWVEGVPVCHSVTGCSSPWPCPAKRRPQHGGDCYPFRDPIDYSLRPRRVTSIDGVASAKPMLRLVRD